MIGALDQALRPRDVIVCAAGSLPGDLHKLWRARDPKSYHLEYGYSCMGYEIAGGLGVKLAAPDRDVYVLVGDGSYLMMAQEISTAVQEGVKLTIVLLDNHGFASIGGLSESVGSGGFGTRVPLPKRQDRRSRRRRAAGRSCRECRVARRTCLSSRHGRRPFAMRWQLRVRRRSRRSSSFQSSVRRAWPAMNRGGMCRLPKCPRNLRSTRRARHTTKPGGGSATFCDSRRQRALFMGRPRV